METHHTFCRICEALCGLEMDVEDGAVVAVRPDPEHVATRGFACVKGTEQHRIFGSPDRVLDPLERVGGEFRAVSWERALGEIGRRVAAIRRDHGPHAIAMYVGTAAGFGVLHPIFAQGFMTGIGSHSMYSSATQDCSNKFAVARHMYGFPFTQTFPDLDRAQCLIVVGANPAVSKWSFLQVSNPVQRLRDLERRGGRLYVVDPRRTETAKAAGTHVPIVAGTDVFFFLAFLRELLALDGAVDLARVERFMTGFDEVARLAAPWTAERVAPITGIPAPALREMVRAYAEADGAALYSSTGVNMGGNGTLAFWIQEVINAVNGNLDRRGGTLVGHGIVDFARFGKKTGALLAERTSRIGGFDAVNDTMPGGVLADEIETPGPDQVRALFVTGGNPLLTMANGARLRAAFEKLDLLVTVDIFRSETGQVADFVLPATSPLERPDLPFVFPLLLGLQSRPYLQATDAVLPRPGNVRDEATIYLDLCRASGVPIFGSRVAQRSLEALRAVHGRLRRRERPLLPQRLLLDALLRAARQPGFRRLLRHHHGYARPDHRGGDFLGARVVTDDGKVQLAPPVLVAHAAKLERDFAAADEVARSDRLRLITRRAVTSHNSWTHNLDRFVRGKRRQNYLYMHPDDAAARGLSEGDAADVASATASVRVAVAITDDLTPGTVALPHGWGHQNATGLSVARTTAGVNANLLAGDGPGALDRVSGMAHLTGIPVTVGRAGGPRDETSWSGR